MKPHPLLACLLGGLLTITLSIAEPASTADDVDQMKSSFQECVELKKHAAAEAVAKRLITAAPTEAAQWHWEIARLNFIQRQYQECLNHIDQLPALQDNRVTLAQAELLALTHEALGHKEQAVIAWKTVWQSGQSAAHALRLASLLTELGNPDAAADVIAKAMTAPNIDSASIKLPGPNRQMQSVPIKAALHNLNAQVILKNDLHAIDAARGELMTALDLCADFEIAKRSLAALTESPTPDN